MNRGERYAVKLSRFKAIYEQIKEGIRRMIVMNVIKQDEKLPSVHVLACKYAINPNNYRKSIQELEEEGYLYTKSGKGTFVADAKTAQAEPDKEI